MRQVFFSFEYNKDNWRASQVRNMGVVDDSSTFCDNDWEEVKRKDDASIRRWIDNQLKMRSCIIVLIGSTTANRKWINYEIKKAYELNKGIVGIYVHKLKDRQRNQTYKGQNPFDYVYTDRATPLSRYVECFDSTCTLSEYVYKDIKNNIDSLIERAIKKAGTF